MTSRPTFRSSGKRAIAHLPLGSEPLGGRDTEERTHRFVTFRRARRPRTAAGPDERPDCATSASWPAAMTPSCDNHRLVRRFR